MTVGGKRFENVYGRVFFVKIRKALKIDNSPHLPLKILRNSRLNFFFAAFHSISSENTPPNLDPGI